MSKNDKNQKPTRLISRREFLLGASTTVLASSASGMGLSSGDKTPDITNVSIEIKNLPRELSGYKIAFFSDTHLGHYLSSDYLRSVVKTVNNLKPNVILMGGDYIWREKSKLAKTLIRFQKSEYAELHNKELVDKIVKDSALILKDLKAPNGVFGVLGNHDHWEVGPKFKRIFANHRSAKILINEFVEVWHKGARIRILGVDDYWTGIPKIPTGWTIGGKKLPPRAFNILLAHNPDYISELEEESSAQFNLALCGHTHGGQIKLPVLGALMHNTYDSRFFEGLVELAPKNRYVFTTRGIGTVELPLRLNCPPEIALISLKAI